MALNTIDELLQIREIKGLKIMLFGKLIIFIILFFMQLFTSRKLSSLFLVGSILLVYIPAVIYFLKLLKQKKYVQFIGYISVSLDIIILYSIPLSWYINIGGVEIPLAFMLKSDVYLIAIAIIIVNSLAFRIQYPIVATLGGVSLFVTLFIMAAIDSRTQFTNDMTVFRSTLNTIHIENQITTTLAILLVGMFITYITHVLKKTIIEAVSMEKVNFNLGRYFSPKIVEEITQAEESFMASLKEVVIMFTDIRGFTSISEKLPPDKVIDLLREYHNLMVNIIFKHGGTIDKFLGDGIMVTFGTPTANPDDVENAVKTALEMQEALKNMNLKQSQDQDFTLSQGIGIHYGSVIAGNIGTEDRLEYTVIGDAVNVASRVERACKSLKKQILITKPVRQRLTTSYDLTEFRGIQVAGKSAKMDLYSVNS